MVIIYVYQSLRNSDLTNTDVFKTEKICKSSVKCEYKQDYKVIIEVVMVSTPEGCTENSPVSSLLFVTVKQPNTRKWCSEKMDFKPKSAVRSLCDSNLKRRAIIVVSMLWSIISKQCGHTTINECIKRDIYNWILQHPQVIQSPIANDCLKLYIDGQAEPQLVPKLLLHVSAIELYNSMVSLPEEGGLKEAREAEDKFITSDSTLRNILPPQLKNMSA